MAETNEGRTGTEEDADFLEDEAAGQAPTAATEAKPAATPAVDDQGQPVGKTAEPTQPANADKKGEWNKTQQEVDQRIATRVPKFLDDAMAPLRAELARISEKIGARGGEVTPGEKARVQEIADDIDGILSSDPDTIDPTALRLAKRLKASETATTERFGKLERELQAAREFIAPAAHQAMEREWESAFASNFPDHAAKAVEARKAYEEEFIRLAGPAADKLPPEAVNHLAGLAYAKIVDTFKADPPAEPATPAVAGTTSRPAPPKRNTRQPSGSSMRRSLPSNEQTPIDELEMDLLERKED